MQQMTNDYVTKGIAIELVRECLSHLLARSLVLIVARPLWLVRERDPLFATRQVLVSSQTLFIPLTIV